ncbi:nuclear valosin-containing protein-like [Lepisosteus oculatus]|uniref:nuclear valosin-containing protein-like n=1 Tax=Lepisosteus oculatus TaxID=7918 RepID=UPI0035F5004D
MKNRGGYFVDNRLKQRVKEYLSSRGSPYVDLAAAAAELQRMYSTEYGRRKRNAFRIQIEKVYAAICNETDITALENEHLAKRARHSQQADGEDKSFTDDTTDTEDDQLEHPPANHMNSSLLSLYRKGTPERGTPVSRELAGDSPAPMPTPDSTPLGTRVSRGGWFIDTAPSESVLIDLCEDVQETSTPGPPDVSVLESGKKRRKASLKKGKRRKEGEPQGTDGEIESSIMGKKVKSKSPDLQFSTVKFEDVGGNEEMLKEVCKMLIHMRHPEVYQQLGVVPPRGFLLHGPPGCGKTLLAQAIAGELELPLLKVSAPELVSGVSGESEQKLRDLFDQAVSSAPCILFIDEIDAITPKREVASKDMERRIVAQLLTCMDDLGSLSVPAQVLVIGATNRPDSLDPALRRAGRFDKEICLGIPDEGARLRILQTLCRKLRLPEAFDLQALAHLTPGYVGADLMALCREAAMTAINRILIEMQDGDKPTQEAEGQGQADGSCTEGASVQPQHKDMSAEAELCRLLALLKSDSVLSEEQLGQLTIEMDDFRASLSSVQPSAKREGFATVPDVTWADIGALQDVREELTMAILAPVRNPEQFRALGLSAPAGVLLAGPPGCGKTLLAKAVANESGLNFISVKGPELLNMYVGESERAVRQVFQRGRNSAPCVIFFDEIDALCPRRSDHESGASVRVVNQLLTEMDGLEARKQVFIMAATNRPDIIDPAVLRPGRLDKTLYVGLPPAADRLAILQTITKGGKRPLLEEDVSLEEIASDERCDCFTGADLSALVREASINALRVHLPPRPSAAAPVVDIRVSRQNFQDALKKVKPSVSKKDQRMYELLKESLSR